MAVFYYICNHMFEISQIPDKRPLKINRITNSFIVKQALVGFLAL